MTELRGGYEKGLHSETLRLDALMEELRLIRDEKRRRLPPI